MNNISRNSLSGIKHAWKHATTEAILDVKFKINNFGLSDKKVERSAYVEICYEGDREPNRFFYENGMGSLYREGNNLCRRVDFEEFMPDDIDPEYVDINIQIEACRIVQRELKKAGYNARYEPMNEQVNENLYDSGYEYRNNDDLNLEDNVEKEVEIDFDMNVDRTNDAEDVIDIKLNDITNKLDLFTKRLEKIYNEKTGSFKIDESVEKEEFEREINQLLESIATIARNIEKFNNNRKN